MSKVLGPIHHWLYAKIGRQEELSACLAETALAEAWISDAEPYLRELAPLEQVIDEGNIHAWLQERIRDAERRFAALVLAAAGEDEARREKLAQAAEAFGRSHAIAAGCSAAEAYRAFEDFFINGMPCDRVNAVTLDDGQSLAWEQTLELHEQPWRELGGELSVYYLLRRRVMAGMLEGSGLVLESPDKDHYCLKPAR